jgi:hypothetical protein
VIGSGGGTAGQEGLEVVKLVDFGALGDAVMGGMFSRRDRDFCFFSCESLW